MWKKIIVVVLIVSIVLFGAFFIVAYTTPTAYTVEKEVTINKPKAETFAYLKMLKNSSEWTPWPRRDPAMKTEYRGTDGQPGFVSSWKGTTSETGEGEQEIKRVVEGERIDTEIRFKEPWESKADAYISTESTGENQTKVKWGLKGEFPRPMNVFLLFMDMDQAIGKDLSEGLTNLKTIMESK
ncbi:MAG TPA: SRPBCC family protein [Pyrinomonadaceae bacterium]|nr:SRPBCC family protein [Pyrinomonadaceae bacterium]